MIPLCSTANPIASNPIRLLQTGNTLFFLKFAFSGDCSGGETPVPIPNTAVKPPSANGTARASVWESRSSPGIYFRVRPMSQNMGRLFFLPRGRHARQLQPLERQLLDGPERLLEPEALADVADQAPALLTSLEPVAVPPLEEEQTLEVGALRA